MITLIPERTIVDNFDLTDYKINEDNNEHTQNYINLAWKFAPYYILVQAFDMAVEINRVGYKTPKQSEWMYENLNQYFTLLKKENK